MKTGLSVLTRCGFSIALSFYYLFGNAASTQQPEVCSSAATSSCCYATCIGMAKSKQYVHGDPSAKLTCKKKCMPDN